MCFFKIFDYKYVCVRVFGDLFYYYMSNVAGI